MRPGRSGYSAEELFDELEGEAYSDDLWIYYPPWHDRMADGGLSPGYGPKSAGAFQTKIQAYRDSIWGGGLWHDDEEPKRVPVARKERRPELLEQLERYVARHSTEMSELQLAFYYGFYRDNKSLGRLAAEYGKPLSTVRELLRRLRRRAEAY